MNSPLPHGQIQPIDQSYGARKTLNRAYTKIKKHPFGTGVFVNNIINEAYLSFTSSKSTSVTSSCAEPEPASVPWS